MPNPKLIPTTPRGEPPVKMEFFPDTEDQCATSIDRTGLRPQLDRAFQDAIARVKNKPRARR